MDDKILEAAVRSILVHVAKEANVDYLYALDQMKLVCDGLVERGDKAVTGRDLIALTVMRIKQQSKK